MNNLSVSGKTTGWMLETAKISLHKGIDYCFEHYSSFEEIKDEEFHRLRLGFLQHMKELREYIDKKVDEGESFELDGGLDDE